MKNTQIHKQKKFEKKRRNVMGMLCLCFLFAVALFLPGIYFAYYDSKSDEDITYIETEMSTYKLQCQSMGERLVELGEQEAAGRELQTTLLQEVNDFETLHHLTERVKKELEVFLAVHISILGEFDAEKVTSCKLYTAYPEEGEEKYVSGCSFWQLVYELEDTIVRVLLDTEFEKIYAVSFSDKEITEEVEREYPSYFEEYGVAFEDSMRYWLDIMVEYYNMNNYSYGSESIYDERGLYLTTDAKYDASLDVELYSMEELEDIVFGGTGRVEFRNGRVESNLRMRIQYKVDEDGKMCYEKGVASFLDYLQL